MENAAWEQHLIAFANANASVQVLHNTLRSSHNSLLWRVERPSHHVRCSARSTIDGDVLCMPRRNESWGVLANGVEDVSHTDVVRVVSQRSDCSVDRFGEGTTTRSTTHR